MPKPRVVAALGGNALLRRGEPPDAGTQRHNVADAVAALAELADECELIVTHGNGPRVGLLALQAASYRDAEPYPMDILGAESEGMIGYLLEQGLRGVRPNRQIAALLTLVQVDPSDPAFRSPSKPIGPIYSRAEAEHLAADRGWIVGPDGASFRRLVPSPRPQSIVEITTIELLVKAGVLVICTGGGGIPVVADGHGALHGVEAVIDKDLSAALLAEQLDADMLLLLTDVDAVQTGWGTAAAEPLRRATTAELRAMSFAGGSMAPKIDAACRFVERTGKRAAIGALGEAARVFHGTAGTSVLGSEMLQATVRQSAPQAAIRTPS